MTMTIMMIMVCWFAGLMQRASFPSIAVVRAMSFDGGCRSCNFGDTIGAQTAPVADLVSTDTV